MREIQASEAKTHLPQLLDEVERGETIVITRHGRPIARLVPEVERRQAEIARAIDSIRARRRRTGRITAEELLSARHEGHGTDAVRPRCLDRRVLGVRGRGPSPCRAALARIRTDEARAPSLWWFEVHNVLLVNERRGRISEADTAGFLHDLSRLGVTLDRSPH